MKKERVTTAEAARITGLSTRLIQKLYSASSAHRKAKLTGTSTGTESADRSRG